MHLFAKKKLEKTEPVTAIIPAAGSSRRMGGENKLLIPLNGIPILVYTLQAFHDCDFVDKIILLCKEEDITEYFSICKEYDLYKVFKIAKGGKTRTESVLAGILNCPDETKWVAVHDAARPFITEEIISDTIKKAQLFGAAAPIVPIKDSIKRVENGKIIENIERDTLAAVQTPQVFEKDLLKKALEQVISDQFPVTDDCSAVEHLGIQVTTTQGSYENIKITTPEDLMFAEAILEKRGDDV